MLTPVVLVFLNLIIRWVELPPVGIPDNFTLLAPFNEIILAPTPSINLGEVVVAFGLIVKVNVPAPAPSSANWFKATVPVSFNKSEVSPLSWFE
jgi:hypothetical protein